MRSPLGAILDRAPIRHAAPTGFLASAPSLADPLAMLNQYGSVGTLFTIVSRIANSVSSVNWHLYRKSTDLRRRYGPAQDTRVEVVRHWALDVWNQPNPFMTRQEFVEVFSQHLELCGEAWWVVGRDDRATLPLELWPVRPDRMEPVPHATKYLAGYTYREASGQKVPLELDEVVFLRAPNPVDPYRGMGPVQSLLVDLDATRYSAQWNRNFFYNDASPGGIIEVERRLSDDEFKEMVLRWREQHEGVRNAHRVAVIEQGKWVDRSFSMRDLQFGELRTVARDIIREAFGYPKPMLGAVDDINRANAEAGELVFARWVVKQRLERIKQALNSDYLPLFGATDLEFDYENPVPPDREADLREQQAAVDMAVKLIAEGFDAAQVLDFLGLPPMTWTRPEPALERGRNPDKEGDDAPPDADAIASAIAALTRANDRKEGRHRAP